MHHRAPPPSDGKARKAIGRALRYMLGAAAVIGVARIALHPREFMLALPHGAQPRHDAMLAARAAVLIRLEEDPRWAPRLQAASFGAFSTGRAGTVCGSIEGHSFAVIPPVTFAPDRIHAAGCPLIGEAAREFLEEGVLPAGRRGAVRPRGE